MYEFEFYNAKTNETRITFGRWIDKVREKDNLPADEWELIYSYYID